MIDVPPTYEHHGALICSACQLVREGKACQCLWTGRLAALRALIAEKDAALEPFAKKAEVLDARQSPKSEDDGLWAVEVGDCRRAKAALERKEAP